MKPEYLKFVFEKYGSDKAEHGYHEFYAKWLPKNPNRILEIGVKEGASIRAWREIFPEAEVHGLDLFKEFPIPDIPGAVFHQGDQTDYKLLQHLRKYEFDVIIDDGSHNSRDQLITFFGIYSGGKQRYFIEDLHCNEYQSYRADLPKELGAKHILDNIVSAYGGEKLIAICSSI